MVAWLRDCTRCAQHSMTPTRPLHAARGGVVLLAEDDDDLRALLTNALADARYGVIEARDGVEALERLDDAIGFPEVAPDVIVTDVRMPRLSGFGVLAAVRRAHVATPVILMSVFGDPSFGMVASRLGAASLLRKPFDARALIEAVRDARPSHDRARAKYGAAGWDASQRSARADSRK